MKTAMIEVALIVEIGWTGSVFEVTSFDCGEASTHGFGGRANSG